MDYSTGKFSEIGSIFKMVISVCTQTHSISYYDTMITMIDMIGLL